MLTRDTGSVAAGAEGDASPRGVVVAAELGADGERAADLAAQRALEIEALVGADGLTAGEVVRRDPEVAGLHLAHDPQLCERLGRVGAGATGGNDHGRGRGGCDDRVPETGHWSLLAVGWRTVRHRHEKGVSAGLTT